MPVPSMVALRQNFVLVVKQVRHALWYLRRLRVCLRLATLGYSQEGARFEVVEDWSGPEPGPLVPNQIRGYIESCRILTSK